MPRLLTRTHPARVGAARAGWTPDPGSATAARRRLDSRRRAGLALVAGDILALTVAFATVEILASQPALAGDVDRIGPLEEIGLFVAVLPIWLVLGHAYGLYRRAPDVGEHTFADELVRILHLTTLGTWLAFATITLTGLGHPDLRRVTAFWMLQISAVLLFRTVGRHVRSRRGADAQRVVVVGAGDVGQLVAQRLVGHGDRDVEVVGFVDASPRPRRPGLEPIGVTKRLEDVLRLVDHERADRVVIAFSRETDARLADIARELEQRAVQVDIVPRLYELVGPHAEVHMVRGVPLVSLPPSHLSGVELAAKRAFDVVAAGLLLLLAAPVLVAAAIAVKASSPGPVLFRQDRVGRGGRTFRIFKLRTMRADAADRRDDLAHLNKHHATGDTRMLKVHDDPRVTGVGRLLRRTSLDELPQLLNVVRGDMSLVGPRPLVPEEAAHVLDWASIRHDLRPGITGLWQVSGRDDLPFGEMVVLDYQYVVGWTLWRDLMILARTLPAVAASATRNR